MGMGIVEQGTAAIRDVVRRILGESQADLRGLMLPRYQSELVAAQRASLIISRVRLVSIFFAVLTPLWIVLDIIFFWPELWTNLAVGRVVAAVAFLGLSLSYQRSERILDAYFSMAILFAIPTAFFAYSHFLFAGADRGLSGMAASLAAGYAFLPFVMAAGLSIFPLTALEGVAFAAPAVIVELIASRFGAVLMEGDTQLGLVWLLVLISAVAVMSGMSQLHYLIEIIIKSSHDHLTSAFNRAAGEELLEKYFLLAQRNRTPLSLIFFDLDKFKSVNDGYGHEAGDIVLRDAAANIIASIRKVDLFIRWGGEEFLVVAPYAPGDRTNALVDRIAETGLGTRPDGKPVTASMGRAEILADNPETLERLIEIADGRMYRAKQSGRNRLCFGDGPDDFLADIFR
ncbi:MAG: GGDEF domain-containing protein [Magnetospirillum sp. WYHS-4]